LSVLESHALCDRIEESIVAELPRASITIHVEPSEMHDGRAQHHQPG
jgi:divalent metal cation (Fe/Co/Zn/Cd) transporter